MQEGYTRAATSRDTASSQEEMMEHKHKSAPAKGINKHLLWLVVETGTDSLKSDTSCTLKGAICHVQQNFSPCRTSKVMTSASYLCMSSVLRMDRKLICLSALVFELHHFSVKSYKCDQYHCPSKTKVSMIFVKLTLLIKFDQAQTQLTSTHTD